jgi:hypothetical protein
VSWRRSRRKRLIFALVCAGLVAAGSYVYTASSTVDPTTAGSGSGAVSGYTASNISYVPRSSNATLVDSVTFDISPTNPATIKVRLAPAGSWYSCTNSGGSVTCDTTTPSQATVAGSTQFTLIAAQ